MEQFAQNIKDLEVTTVDRARQAIADKETATFFRSEYSIPTVHGFVHVQDGQVAVRCDSSMTADEIKAFAGI